MMRNKKTKPLIVLFDYDGEIYKAVHKIASFGDIRKWFIDKRSKEWMAEEIIQLSLNRLSQLNTKVLEEIEQTSVEIEHVEYFLTTCRNSFRKEVSPIYKANRKRNKKKWVGMVRSALVKEDSLVVHDDKYEADDLIKDRSVEITKEFGENMFIIASPDKDFKQIAGIHFDTYREILKDENGDRQLDENGYRKISPCNGLHIVRESEASHFFWKQMLMGDSSDNIKGIPRIGKVKAAKILEDVDPKNYRDIVYSEYQEYWTKIALKDYEKNAETVYKTESEAATAGKKQGEEQFELHKLLLGLGVKHRP